ncbi:AAA family ATPase [Ideonella sp.]|uniref:AAA family ATPase n=1 Tax=Ideonella sp. TaxID=1929293 RepID=UPI002B473D88|nr:AAA family ATPase [Ideonella sp.]HJV67741.1 AAA family ATPase [Ideonella sp.]
MPHPNHVSPDHFLNLEEADVVTKEQVASAWELAYGALRQKLVAAGERATLFVVFGLQGAGKSTWVARNAPLMGSNSIFLDGPLPSRRHRSRALGIASEVGCRAVAVWVNTPLELAKSRNATRRGLARIREEAILHVFEHLEPPSLEEGFAEIVEVLPHNVPPSPCLEGTPPSGLRPLSAVPHVER